MDHTGIRPELGGGVAGAPHGPAAAAASPRLRKLQPWLRRTAAPVTLVVLVFGAAEFIIRWAEVSSYIFPAPSAIVRRLCTEWDNIAPNLWVTTVEAVSGFAIAAVLAVLVATLFVHMKLAERAFYPFIVVLQTLPVIIIAPILVILFGNGLGPKIVIAVLITFFPTLVNMTRGLRAVDPLSLELFAVMNASKLQTFTKLRFPTSLPYLFSSLKIAAANCFIGAIVGEWIAADRGIGYMAQINLHLYNVDVVYATVLASSLTAIAFTGLISFIEILVCGWRVGKNEG